MKAMAASEATKRVHAKKSPPPMAAAGLLGPYLVWLKNKLTVPLHAMKSGMNPGHMTMRLLKSMSLSEAALARTVTLLSNRPDDTSRNVDEEQNDVMP